MTVARRLAGAGCILVLAVAVSPVWLAPSAQAATTIGLSGSTGSPGDTVTVSGSGWVANQPVSLWLDGSHASYPTTSTSLPPATAGPAGELQAAFVIPAQSIGSFQVRACQDCEFDTARAPLAVVPGLHLSATQVKVNQRVGVSGTGWPWQAGEVYLFADPADRTDPTKALAHQLPDQSWQLTTEFSVPPLARGPHELFACQACAGTVTQPRIQALSAAAPGFNLTARAAYVIVVPTLRPPTLDLNPDQGAAQAKIAASGSGWVDGAGPVRIFARKQDVGSAGKALVSVAPTTKGTLSVSFPAPPLKAGKHVFYACQVCTGSKARLAFHAFVTLPPPPQATPTLDVDPSSAKSGATVTVRGSRWKPDGGAVSIFADASLRFDLAAALLTIQPGVNGAFQAPLVLPALAAGSHILYACQSCTEAAGFPSATRELTIARPSSILPLLLVGLAVATLAGTGWALRRIRRGATPSPRETRQGPTAQPGPPHFRARPDDNLGIAVRSPEGPRPPSLRLVPRQYESPDPAPVEVRT